VPVSEASFRLVSGQLSLWQRTAESGNSIDCAFCPRCGSRLWHRSSQAPEMLRVRGGTVDTPPDLSAAVHIWTKRKLGGVVIPATAKTFPGQPE
jgi:hypothetical protein